MAATARLEHFFHTTQPKQLNQYIDTITRDPNQIPHMLTPPSYKQKLREAIEGKHSDAAQEESTVSSAPHLVSTSSRSDVSAITEATAQDERQSEASVKDSMETEDNSGERTDTGALLQAGSLVAGAVGIGLMLAFGNGGSKKEEKKKGKH